MRVSWKGLAARGRAIATVVGLAALAAVGGCEFGQTPIAPGAERTVVHAVLNPEAEAGFVLVERTLSGRVRVRTDTIGNANDPITGGGGVPVSGARVEVRDATGASALAFETTVLPSGSRTPRGTGMYRFENLAVPPSGPVVGERRGVRVVPGGRYTIRVQGPDGALVTGETLVPGDARTSLANPESTLTFLRDRDTLALRWTPVPNARSYLLRVESPYGAFFLFSDTAGVTLTGELRNLFAERLPRVFQAGFTQWVTVAAVDTNFFDYYRSGNSPFTGSGLINRLQGGIGLFGAYVPVRRVGLFVRATDRDPFDGRYEGRGPQGIETLRLWVDARTGALAEVTGAYRLAGEEQFGVLGTLDGTRLQLRGVVDVDARIVGRTLEGEVRGDTLVLQVRPTIQGDDGRRRFVRVRATPAP